MYSKIAKVFILLFYFKQICGKSFCDEKELDSIHTHEIYTKDNNTYSLVDIKAGNNWYRWNLEANNITLRASSKDQLTSIFIPVLPDCTHSGDDCQELKKLSNTVIKFKVNINTFSYIIAPKGEEECSNCELPWNMSATGDPTDTKLNGGKRLWPNNLWVRSSGTPLGAFDPSSNQLIFIIRPNDPLFDSIKIMRNSLKASDWMNSWITEEIVGTTGYSFNGMASLIAVNDITGQPLRNNMNRVFAFRNIETEGHEVWEYYNNKFTKSSEYDYRSLFQCPQISNGSALWVYVLIAVVIIAVVVVLIILAAIAYYCGKQEKKTTLFQLKSSSSGGAFKSSDSFTDSKRGSKTSQN